jgi:hypothetical protein
MVIHGTWRLKQNIDCRQIYYLYSIKVRLKKTFYMIPLWKRQIVRIFSDDVDLDMNKSSKEQLNWSIIIL